MPFLSLFRFVPTCDTKLSVGQFIFSCIIRMSVFINGSLQVLSIQPLGQDNYDYNN
jgi:hypothetical protein